jgi:hypothetical protein
MKLPGIPAGASLSVNVVRPQTLSYCRLLCPDEMLGNQEPHQHLILGYQHRGSRPEGYGSPFCVHEVRRCWTPRFATGTPMMS